MLNQYLTRNQHAGSSGKLLPGIGTEQIHSAASMHGRKVAYTVAAWLQRAGLPHFSLLTWMTRQPPSHPPPTPEPLTHQPPPTSSQPPAAARALPSRRGELYPAPRRHMESALSSPTPLSPGVRYRARFPRVAPSRLPSFRVRASLVLVEGELLLEAVVLLAQVEAVLLPRPG